MRLWENEKSIYLSEECPKLSEMRPAIFAVLVILSPARLLESLSFRIVIANASAYMMVN